MQCIRITILFAVVAAQPYCNSFVLGSNYYDINLGSSTDQQLTTPQFQASAIFTYNLCSNVSTICEVLTTSGATTAVQDYEVTSDSNTRATPSSL